LALSLAVMKAMLLAAGRGERLRPLTDQTPKPLLKVGGKALIVHHLLHLAGAGFEEVVINLGWLGEQIPKALGNGERWGLTLRYSREPPGALETAGGIIHALPLLGAEPFVVISSDVICDYPLTRLRERRFDILAHLIMVDNPAHHPDGDFALRDNRLSQSPGRRLTYSGIGLFEPRLFAAWPPGRRPLRPLLEYAIEQAQLGGEYHAGRWLDVGTADRLAAARELLRGA